MRVEGNCCGDCSRCALLENGQVDMVPCILDQIFQRTQKNEKAIQEVVKRLDALPVNEKKPLLLSGGPE